jgi:hypothetical protein
MRPPTPETRGGRSFLMLLLPAGWWQLSRCDNSARVRAGGTNGCEVRLKLSVAPL